MTAQTDILAEVVAERQRHPSLGWTTEHDDAHSVNDWVANIARYLGRAGDAAEGSDASGYRHRLVQVMAIGLAAVESLDRVMGIAGATVCRRCHRDAEIPLGDNVCADCADDLRDEAAADAADPGA